jgi:hypothetical protein
MGLHGLLQGLLYLTILEECIREGHYISKSGLLTPGTDSGLRISDCKTSR